MSYRVYTSAPGGTKSGIDITEDAGSGDLDTMVGDGNVAVIISDDLYPSNDVREAIRRAIEKFIESGESG